MRFKDSQINPINNGYLYIFKNKFQNGHPLLSIFVYYYYLFYVYMSFFVILIHHGSTSRGSFDHDQKIQR